MNLYRAITESGATYLIGEGFWKHRKDPVERIWAFKSVDPADLVEPLQRKDNKAFWDAVHNSKDVEAPVVGEHIYISSRDVWRISTKVVSVEELDGWPGQGEAPYVEDQS